jgi:hypothetical protein
MPNPYKKTLYICKWVLHKKPTHRVIAFIIRRQSVSEDKICAAYVAAFAELEAATKTANNQHFKSKYADLPAVIDAIKPHLSKHGLAFMQMPKPSEGGISIETVLIHSSGECLSMGVLFVPANRQDAHGFGSALTYARRYALQTCFGLPTEDDDGNAAVKSQQVPAKTITAEQFAQLQDLVDRTGTDVAVMAAHYKVPALAMLPLTAFEAAKAALEKKLTNV